MYGSYFLRSTDTRLMWVSHREAEPYGFREAEPVGPGPQCPQNTKLSLVFPPTNESSTHRLPRLGLDYTVLCYAYG